MIKELFLKNNKKNKKIMKKNRILVGIMELEVYFVFIEKLYKLYFSIMIIGIFVYLNIEV